MDIVYKKSNMIQFGELPCGKVFKDEYSNYCMKIEGNNNINIVYLTNGSLGRKDDFERVEIVHCELIVNN